MADTKVARERYVFGPIALLAKPYYRRAELEFYGINHFRPSYVARLFFNDPGVYVDSSTEKRPTYAGSFAIFGHSVCVGEEGHCVAHPHLRRFDDRPSHPLTRAFKRVIVTDALRRCQEEADELTVTVVATADMRRATAYEGPLLDFNSMQLTTFD